MHALVGAVEAAPNFSTMSATITPSLPHSRDQRSCPDTALVRQLASGDATALDLIYQRHYEPAFAVALALLRDRSAAEDLVHEAFLRAWRRAGSFQSHRGAFRSWLLTIVRNAAIDQLRQQAMQRRPSVMAAQESLHAVLEPDVINQAILSLEADRLYRALGQLPPEQRTVIQQAFFGELSHREIAEREGLPLGTVKGRVRLGLYRLRSLLDESGMSA